MSFKKTARLASLLLACPLVVPDVSVAANDWPGENKTVSSGDVTVSTIATVPAGQYDNAYCSHAVHTGTEGGAYVSPKQQNVTLKIANVTAENLYIMYAEGHTGNGVYTSISYNDENLGIKISESTINNNMYFGYAYGSSADVYRGSATIWKLTFSADDGELCAGRAEAVGEKGNASVSKSAVIVEVGCKVSYAYGGWASSQSGIARAVDNGVTMRASTIEACNDIYGSYAVTNSTDATLYAEASYGAVNPKMNEKIRLHMSNEG